MFKCMSMFSIEGLASRVLFVHAKAMFQTINTFPLSLTSKGNSKKSHFSSLTSSFLSKCHSFVTMVHAGLVVGSVAMVIFVVDQCRKLLLQVE